jgi:hypothetical protein
MNTQIDAYRDIKLHLVEGLKYDMQNIQQKLIDEDQQGEDFDGIKKSLIYSFIQPFCELLNEELDSAFRSDELDFDTIKDRYIDLTNFMLRIFEPTAELLSEAFRSNDYSRLVARFYHEVLPNLH